MKVEGAIKLLIRDKDTLEVVKKIEKKNLIVDSGIRVLTKRMCSEWIRGEIRNIPVVAIGVGPFSFEASGNDVISATKLPYGPEHQPTPDNIHLINITFFKRGTSYYDAENNRAIWHARVWEYEYNTVTRLLANYKESFTNNPRDSLRAFNVSGGVIPPIAREIGVYDETSMQVYNFPWGVENIPNLLDNPPLINRIILPEEVQKIPTHIWDIYIVIRLTI